MKCRLCDRPTAAGTGKLCADCAKALHRARGAALSKLPPGAAVAAQSTRATPITLTASPPATLPRSSRPLLWVAAAGLVAIALVYFVQQDWSNPSSAGTPGMTRAPAAMTERVSVEPSPVITRVEEPSWTAVGDAAKASNGGETAETPAGVAAAKPPVVPGGIKTSSRQAKGATQDAKSVPQPLPAEYDAAPKPAEVEPQQQLAGAKVSAPAQPVDSAQVLAGAMQKCGSEGGFSKFICEQKTYYAYCEDKWDKDPKCMRKTAER